MNEFDYEVYQRKRIARGAAAKKNGSKSKKCTMPSDYLTAAQKKKLNGDVKTMNIKKAITKEEFERYPDDIKKLYILTVREMFGASNGEIADMLGYERTKISRLTIRLGIENPPRGRRKSRSAE